VNVLAFLADSAFDDLEIDMPEAFRVGPDGNDELRLAQSRRDVNGLDRVAFELRLLVNGRPHRRRFLAAAFEADGDGECLTGNRRIMRDAFEFPLGKGG